MRKALTTLALVALLVAGAGLAGCKSAAKTGGDCAFCMKTGMTCKTCQPGAPCEACVKCGECPNCTADKACEKCMAYMQETLSK